MHGVVFIASSPSHDDDLLIYYRNNHAEMRWLQLDLDDVERCDEVDW